MILTVTLNPAIDRYYEVDNFHVNGAFRTNFSSITAGGKGVNVAKVCKTLGAEVSATGLLGGFCGQIIHYQLGHLDIKDEFLEIDGESRCCINIRDKINNNSTEILEKGPVITDDIKYSFSNYFEKIMRKADIIIISGSLPIGIHANFYGRLIRKSKEINKPVFLDTSDSILKQSIEYKPYLIKPNVKELESIVNIKLLSEESIINCAKDIHCKGIPIVCVTMGEKGCIVVSDEGIYKIGVPKIETISSIGSGDAFLAGYAVSLLKGKSVKDCAMYACACGVSNTQFYESGKVTIELLDKFKNLISLEQIK